MKKPSVWPAIVLVVVIYLIAAIIEPCDGHSCDEETITQN